MFLNIQEDAISIGLRIIDADTKLKLI